MRILKSIPVLHRKVNIYSKGVVWSETDRVAAAECDGHETHPTHRTPLHTERTRQGGWEGAEQWAAPCTVQGQGSAPCTKHPKGHAQRTLRATLLHSGNSGDLGVTADTVSSLAPPLLRTETLPAADATEWRQRSFVSMPVLRKSVSEHIAKGSFGPKRTV